MRSLFVFLFIVFHLLKIAKFVAHARLSQYVNPAKQLPCQCLSPSLTGQVHISPFLQKKLFRLSDRAFAQPSLASKISSVAVEPFYFDAFCSAVGLIPVFPGRSDSRFESALLPPHLEVGWFGRATRK